MKPRPIRPSDFKSPLIPDQVIEAFNELIAEKFNNNSAIITIDDAKNRIVLKMEIDYDEINMNWLNVERIYREVGWKVHFDHACAADDYESYYVFKKQQI